MELSVQQLLQTLRSSEDLRMMAGRLWHAADPAGRLNPVRARAVLRSAGLLDEVLLADFEQVQGSEKGERLALHDLLQFVDPASLGGQTAERTPLSWLCLILAVHARAHAYPLDQLDPASPPQLNTPAGIVLQQAIQFMHRQVRRSATERDRLYKKVAFNPAAAPTLDGLPASETPLAPVPPHFRSPVPVRYPEFNPPLQVDEAEVPDHLADRPALVITTDDLPQSRHQPPLELRPEQIPAGRQPRPVRPHPRSAAGADPTSSIGHALRQMFKSEPLKSTRLRVVVQEFPDGPGLFGLQVKVTCRGIRSFVAGTTDREGRFVCELPVRLRSGLTYSVAVTWPRDMGGEIEEKAITLNADRTEFNLPFYRTIRGS